jgi:hypothetical protein
MSGTHTDILLAALFLAGIALFGLAMLGVALRVGPKRGTWNQPAAALVRPGRGMFVTMYVVAAVHVLLGLIAAIKVPGAGVGVLVVLVAMAAFYVLCAHSFALATRVAHRRHH